MPHASRATGRANRSFQQRQPASYLHEKAVYAVHGCLVVEPCQMLVIVVAEIRQIANCLLRLAHVGQRMQQPAITPTANLPHCRHALLNQHQFHFAFDQGRIRILSLAELPPHSSGILGREFEEDFFCKRKILLAVAS